MGLPQSQVDAIQTVAVAILVVSMMVSLGLKVQPKELGALVRRPRVLLTAAAVNIIAVPAVVFFAASALGVEGDPLIAVVLCAAAPAGPAAALYTNTAKADLPAAAVLTIIIPAIGLLTTPLTVGLWLGTDGDPLALALPMARTLVLFQVVPLGTAMMVRARAPVFADTAAPWATRIANALLALVAVALLALKGHVLGSLTLNLWFTLVILAATSILLGYLGGLPSQQTARTGAIVGISRNVTVALLLAAAYFPRPAVDATMLGFAVLATIAPLGLSFWWRRHPVADPNAQSDAQSDALSEAEPCVQPGVGTRKPGVSSSAKGA